MNRLIILSALALSFSASANIISEEALEKCFEAYSQSNDSEVVAARQFMGEAMDDYDYESNDRMAAFIRQEKGLGVWQDSQSLDPMNYAISEATTNSMSQYCGGKLMTLSDIQSDLLNRALPLFFENNPSEAKEIGWKK